MPDGRGTRIALEAAFLVAVAAVLGFADVRPLLIVLLMLLAWVIVALLEWVAWRDEPHWSAGLPPRYYVPQQPLPPRPPSEELPAFSAYPRPAVAPRVTEAPTWIATPEMREELFGWPTPQQEPREEPPGTTTVEEPPPTEAPIPEDEILAEPVASEPAPVDELPDELLDAASAAAAPEREPDVETGGWPFDDDVEPALDPWFVEAPPPEAHFDEEPERRRALAPEPVAQLSPEPEPEPEAEQASAPTESGQAAPEPAPPAPRLARHRIDPFPLEPARRWPWQHRLTAAAAIAELPPLPRHHRLDGHGGDGR